MTTMKNNTIIDDMDLSPNPIDSGEPFLIDVQARNRTTWGDYSADTWQSVNALVWG